MCNGCGNADAVRLRFSEDRERPGCLVECCDACGGLSSGAAMAPDVYFHGPYHDPHLAHPDRPWEAARGPLVESKRHKLRLLREQGLREAGDRKGGAINFDPHLARRAQEEGFGPTR